MKKKHFMMCALLLASLSATAQINSEGINRGFRHPGGFHSQEDFERVKQQIAEGQSVVTKAYNALVEWAKTNTDTSPGATTEIIRNNGSPNNTKNTAYRLQLAYKYALLWNLTGEAKYGDIAVNILNTWASVCKRVTGDTNAALASGLQGYQFAQVAEIMRSYEGWKEEDFNKFKKWMLDVFYSGNIRFLYTRNAVNPGGYWSNWGLANALSVMSIGVLCDDVYVYNVGSSFIKYDMVPENPKCNPNYKHTEWWDYTQEPYASYPVVLEDADGQYRDNGYNEYLGNFVYKLHQDERGVDIHGDGKLWLGQMQELGRDQGHNTMTVGEIADICQTAWSQDDDIWSWMGNRLAAGLECTALYNFDKECEVPFTKYHYKSDNSVNNRSEYSLLEASSGSRGQYRPVWYRVIGHYEGVKGMKMDYSRKMAESNTADLDEGGVDHLGFTHLMSVIPARTDGKRLTYLEPYVVVDGKEQHKSCCSNLNVGTTVTLKAVVPETETGGSWSWNLGNDVNAQDSKTNELTVTPAKSNIYRVTYKAPNGTVSTQMFSIAVHGDCCADPVQKYFYVSHSEDKTYDGWKTESQATIFSGSTITLSCQAGSNAGTWRYYVKNAKGDECNLNGGMTIEKDTTVYAEYTNEGGATSVDSIRFLTLRIGEAITANKNQVPEGDYYLKKRGTNLYWTNPKIAGAGVSPVLEEKLQDDDETQIWTLALDGEHYKLTSKFDGRYINEKAQFHTNAYSPEWNTYDLYDDGSGNVVFQITQLAATGSKWSLGDYYFWNWKDDKVEVDKSRTEITSYEDFIFTLIPTGGTDGIDVVENGGNRFHDSLYYDLQGRGFRTKPSAKGIYVKDGRKVLVK